MAHGPGLVSLDEIELVGVWGRHLDRAQPVAQELGARAYDDYAALLRDVDAVAFTVPPDVQAVMATEAAKAGKHLLLEKPVATTVPAAQALADAARDVVSVVFFTDRFASTARSWFEDVHGAGVGTVGGCAGSVPSRLRATRSAPHPGGTSWAPCGTPVHMPCPPCPRRSGPLHA